MKQYKTIEEIRKANGFSQIEWAQVIGSTFRTYQARLHGDQPEWKLSEIVKASEYNKGYIEVPTPLCNYQITVKKMDKE